MATMPLAVESDGWTTPRSVSSTEGTAVNAHWDGQTALQLGEDMEPSPPPAPEAAPLTPIVGFLVSYDRLPEGEVFPVRQGRSIITGQPMKCSSRPILIPDASIGFAHAILRTAGIDTLEFIDQLSETGSGLVRKGVEEPIQENVQKLRHGDMIRMGNRRFHLCMIAR
jgi:hypothetical protein